MDSPDQMQQALPTAIGQQFLANNGAPQVDSDTSAVPAPALTPQTGPSPTAPAAAPSPEQVRAAKHQSIGKMFTSMLSGGSGSSASNFWRSLVGGAIVGMGAADDQPVVARGPYGDVRDKSVGGAASRGFKAGMGLQQEQQDRQRKQTQQDAEEKRRDQESKIQLDDAMLRKASDARAQQASIQSSVEHEKRMTMLDQSIQSGNWEQSQRTAKAAQDQVAFFNALQDVGATPLADRDGKALQFSTHDDAEKAAHDNPKFFIGDFKTRTAYDPSTGKYGVYRVPDTDIKNVQLKDPVTGTMHTIPRMTSSEYLDYQTRVQGLQKGALGIEEAKERLAQLREDRKSGSAYSKALEELDKVGGDADKLSPSSRTLLYSTASKNLEGALRAHTAAVKAEDADAAEISLEAMRHYSGVLSQLHGNKPAPNGESGLTPAQYSQALSHALTLPPDQAVAEINSAKVFSDADKARLIADIQKSGNRTPDQKRAAAQSVVDDNAALTGPNPSNF